MDLFSLGPVSQRMSSFSVSGIPNAEMTAGAMRKPLIQYSLPFEPIPRPNPKDQVNVNFLNFGPGCYRVKPTFRSVPYRFFS